jgi:flagellar basal-body rod protein FlgF
MMSHNYGYASDGLTTSIKGMHTHMQLLKTHTDNIANFSIPGYQKKESVITTFAEYMGPKAVNTVVNTEIGRLRQSGRPLDLALNTKGYFQRLGLEGTVDMSRDGRFQVDKAGYLRSLDNQHILSAAGQPIQFPFIPRDLEQNIKVSEDGTINLYDTRNGKHLVVAQLGIASELGLPASQVDVKQGYVEDSNVMLQNEYMAIMPLRREMEANRQMFIIQNDALSRTIQDLKQ